MFQHEKFSVIIPCCYKLLTLFYKIVAYHSTAKCCVETPRGQIFPLLACQRRFSTVVALSQNCAQAQLQRTTVCIPFHAGSNCCLVSWSSAIRTTSAQTVRPKSGSSVVQTGRSTSRKPQFDPSSQEKNDNKVT